MSLTNFSPLKPIFLLFSHQADSAGDDGRGEPLLNLRGLGVRDRGIASSLFCTPGTAGGGVTSITGVAYDTEALVERICADAGVAVVLEPACRIVLGPVIPLEEIVWSGMSTTEAGVPAAARDERIGDVTSITGVVLKAKGLSDGTIPDMGVVATPDLASRGVLGLVGGEVNRNG